MDELAALRGCDEGTTPDPLTSRRMILTFERRLAELSASDPKNSSSPDEYSPTTDTTLATSACTHTDRTGSRRTGFLVSVAAAVLVVLAVAALGFRNSRSNSSDLGSAATPSPPTVSTTSATSTTTADDSAVVVVAHPDASDTFTLGKGRTRFELPRPTDVPAVDGHDAYAKVSGGATPASPVRVVLLRYTDSAGGVLTGDGSIVPDNVGRLVWLVARVPGGAHLSTIDDDSTGYTLHLVDAMNGRDLGAMGASPPASNSPAGQ